MTVKEVCTDMDPFYINLAKEVFPNARIVIDHYHVIAWSLKLMNETRTSLQIVHKKKFDIKQLLVKSVYRLDEDELSKLQPCFEAFPEVERSWEIVNQLRKVYRQTNWRKANSELRKTICYCEQSLVPEMKSLAKTLRKHKEGILNYYISKTTNAYTEGVHRRYELIKRGHCGIRNVERFSKRLMFCMLPFSVIAQILAQSVY